MENVGTGELKGKDTLDSFVEMGLDASGNCVAVTTVEQNISEPNRHWTNY